MKQAQYEVPMLLMAIMWLIFVGTTVWAYVQVRSPYAMHSASAEAARPEAMHTVQYVPDPEGTRRFVTKGAWFCLATVGLIGAVALASFVYGESRRRE
ncbi:MAG: hypothetical protein ACYCW6_12540 [Candidatus Xenobia bacterium]